MDYSLAKELKECVVCKEDFEGGFKAFRCPPCQFKVHNERRKGYNRKYRAGNRAKITRINLAYQTTKRATDPVWREWEKTKYHKRRALIEGNGGIHTTSKWLALVAANDNECANCHEDKPLTRDHIVPLSRGGTNDISNIQPLCGSCNSSKGARLVV